MANRINYRKTVDQANEIQNLSDDLNDEVGKLETLLSQIKREWKGPASEAYQKQLVMLIADMRTTESNMSSLAVSIKNTARRIRDEDREDDED